MQSLVITSKNRRDQSATSSPSFFVADFADNIQGVYRVVWAIIPNTIYNIRLSVNDGLDISGIGQTTIPPGNYSGATLAAALKTILDTRGAPFAPYVVNFNETTGKLEIASDNGDPTVFFDGSANSSLGIVIDSFAGFQTVVSGGSPALPIFLGVPLMLGVHIRESSFVGYRTSGFEYASAPQTSIVDGKSVPTQTYTRSTVHEGTFLVPFVAASNRFSFIAEDTNPQLIRIHKGTRSLTIKLTAVDESDPIQLNNCVWALRLERVSGIKKRQRGDDEMV